MTAAAALALLLATSASPAPSAARIASDMAFLAGDAFEGRRPGTPAEARTLAAIEKSFAAAGLAPAFRSGWRQPVVLEERSAGRKRFAVLRQGNWVDLSSAVLLLGKTGREKIHPSRLAYVGHAESRGSFKGAILLYRDRPRTADVLAQIEDDHSRRERLAAGGAAMILSIVDARTFKRLVERNPAGMIESASGRRPAIQGYIEEEAARRIAALAGTSLDALDRAGREPGFTRFALPLRGEAEAETRVRRFTSANLVGRLPGATRPGEAIVYTAHWDAFGRCRPRSADAICNGAVDNASGIAGLIELARMFAAGRRPDRSILFVATTAEEHGLLGARAYVRSPAVPLARTVAAINIDTIALYGRGQPVGFVGAGLTNADPRIARLAAAQGRRLDTGEGPRFVAQSSDAWPLLKAGIPAFILSGVISNAGPDGGGRFRELIATRLHGPSDEMHDGLVLDGAVEDLDLAFRLGLELAEKNAWVSFLPHVPFRRPPRP